MPLGLFWILYCRWSFILFNMKLRLKHKISYFPNRNYIINDSGEIKAKYFLNVCTEKIENKINDLSIYTDTWIFDVNTYPGQPGSCVWARPRHVTSLLLPTTWNWHAYFSLCDTDDSLYTCIRMSWYFFFCQINMYVKRYPHHILLRLVL